jgi:2-methylisocitrate lyase-like PEP mutase family enzyme
MNLSNVPQPADLGSPNVSAQGIELETRATLMNQTTSAGQAEKALVFRALHERNEAFIIPTRWDCGTAKLLAHLGFEALAITSMGCALSLGQRDSTLSREQGLARASAVVWATDLPVSADLENGFGTRRKIPRKL